MIKSRIFLFLFFVFSILLTSCGSSTKKASSTSRSGTYSKNTSSSSVSAKRSNAVSHGLKYKGTHYKYGSADASNGLDCSGFTTTVYKHIGITLPRRSADQATTGKTVSLKDVKKGDLVFFKRDGAVFHVSMVTNVGNGKLEVIHSTSSKGVIVQDILQSSYWKPLISHFKSIID